MALVSLAVKADDDGADKAVAYAGSEQKYGYGTTIRLEPEQVKALGIDKLTAGQMVMVRAAAFVCQLSAAAGDGDGDESGGGEVSVGLQLTQMEVATGMGRGEAAGKLFGGD